MIHQHAVALLSSDAPDTGSGGGLVTFYYVTGCIVALGGLLEGARRFFNRQRQKWTDEGEGRAKQAQAIQENNDLLKKNTVAIGDLTEKLSDFVITTRSEMNGLGHRISVLERYRKDRQDNDYEPN
jgi:hypothetical protein